jgi:hypothetical protein
VILSIIDGQKQTTYLIHIVPFYLISLAIVLGWFWNKKRVPRLIVVGIMCAVIAVPLGGMALKIRQNTYGNHYRPLIAFLNENSRDGGLIMGGAELAFGLGFGTNHVADGRFAYYTGKRPKFIVYDSAVDNSWKDSKIHFPGFYEYFPRLLNEEYQLAFENAAFKVYERR